MKNSIERLDPADRILAEEILRVQLAAYRQEAELLGAKFFPPLGRTLEELQSRQEQFFGVRVGGKVAAVLSAGPDPAGGGMRIASLTVAPPCQRLGLGRLLVAKVLAEFGPVAWTVATGAGNGPALALYAGFGFQVRSRARVGPEGLEIVELRRG